MNQETINIYAKHGDKVIYAYPTHGDGFDQKRAKIHLKLGEVYTVDYTEVDRYSTKVWLKEFPNKDLDFNSVMFKDYE